MNTATDQHSPVVFISFAHESDAYRAKVGELAAWLTTQGCTVLTDHPYIHRPPKEGWQVWMQNCIREADVVLVACSPRLKARYEKTEVPEIGFGAIFEGAIVTQHIYDAQMQNTKFYPILPDGGSLDDVPSTLRPWWNGHYFSRGNEGIRRLIFDDLTSDSSIFRAENSAGNGEAIWQRAESKHLRRVEELLSEPEAMVFCERLRKELRESMGEFSGKEFVLPIVQHVASCPPEKVQHCFNAVRRALHAIASASIEPAYRRAAEEAAAALYCLAACGLVNRATFDQTKYAYRIPSSEPLVCVVVATALFGGELRLVPTENPALPGPEFLFRIDVAEDGDRLVESFHRAVYCAVFSNNENAPDVVLDSGPLSREQLDDLASEFNNITEVNGGSLVLLLDNHSYWEVGQTFGQEHKVPIMFPDDDATTALLGMSPSRLKAEFRQLWKILQILPDVETA